MRVYISNQSRIVKCQTNHVKNESPIATRKSQKNTFYSFIISPVLTLKIKQAKHFSIRKRHDEQQAKFII